MCSHWSLIHTNLFPILSLSAHLQDRLEDLWGISIALSLCFTKVEHWCFICRTVCQSKRIKCLMYWNSKPSAPEPGLEARSPIWTRRSNRCTTGPAHLQLSTSLAFLALAYGKKNFEEYRFYHPVTFTVIFPFSLSVCYKWVLDASLTLYYTLCSFTLLS